MTERCNMAGIKNGLLQAFTKFLTLISILGSVAYISSGFTTQVQGADFTAYDLIAGVNTIRQKQGLPPVNINATIMAVAQAHSEYQASMHQSSHAGASGEIVTSRVAASGYGNGQPIVAGENVASLSLGTKGMLPIILNEIWADPVHRGAMINPKYQDAGVGIASDDKMVYITLNLAGVTKDSSQTLNLTVNNATAETQPGNSSIGTPVILPLVTSTPMSDGSVYHVVGYGQTLGTIARIYGMDIKDLVRINNIDANTIFAGQRLFIKKVDTPTVAPMTATVPVSVSETNIPSATQVSPSNTPIPASTPKPSSINTRETGILIIFALFIVILVVFLFSNMHKYTESGDE